MQDKHRKQLSAHSEFLLQAYMAWRLASCVMAALTADSHVSLPLQAAGPASQQVKQ